MSRPRRWAMYHLTRGKLLASAVALGTATPPIVGCSPISSHEDIARDFRRPIDAKSGDQAQLLRELVRYSTVAPSSHNTQCWKFRVRPDSITIEPDLSRRLPIVDPDDHHLIVSLGCATESLAHAALANGLHANAQFDVAGTGAALGLRSRRPDLVVRFGRGPTMPLSMRRPVQAVLL